MLRALSLCLMLVTLASCAPDRPSTGPRLGRLAGSILDADGLPAHGALISAEYPANPYALGLLMETDANGHFDFGEVTAGDWVLTVNHGIAWAAAETLFAPSTTSGVRLLNAGAIRGHARLLGANLNANIIVSTPFPEAAGESDITGAFVIGGIAPGRWRAFFFHTAYRDTSTTFTMPGAGDTTTVPDMLLVPNTAP